MTRADDEKAWNFSVNLWDVTFITLGFSLISKETVLPVLVSQLTDSKLAIGLVPAVWSLGIHLPQLLTANMTERMVYKKPFIALVSLFCERVPYLLVGLVRFLPLPCRRRRWPWLQCWWASAWHRRAPAWRHRHGSI